MYKFYEQIRTKPTNTADNIFYTGYIIMNKSMSAYSTYVFNDRFSFDGDKKLHY